MRFIGVLMLFTFITSYGQENIEWSSNHELSAFDFNAKPPNTGEEQSIYAYCGIEYKALNFQLLFGNLNPVVSNTFNPNASWLDEGHETEILLRYAQTSWDLTELSARKFRKIIHENRKNLSLSKMNSFLQNILVENTNILSEYSKESKFGRDETNQILWESKIDSLLQMYAKYCKDCKKPKKPKKFKGSQ